MSSTLERRTPSQGASGDALVLRAYQRCEWYELALMRHGFTVERLMKLSRKIASDALRLRGATLGDRFDDLVSRLQMVGLQASIRFDPERHHESYGKNGGEPFASYVADIMGKRVDDYFRSKAEGFGDRRYGNDNRVVLSGDLGSNTGAAERIQRKLNDDDPDPADHDVDFEELLDERRRAKWQQAADMTGWTLTEYVCITLDKASADVLRSAA